MKLARQVTGRRMRDVQVGLRAQSICNGAAIHGGEYLLDVFVVETEDRGAVERHFADEFGERAPDLAEAGIVVQMFAIDISHDRGQIGAEASETISVALVGFGLPDNPICRAAQLALPITTDFFSADHDRGIEPGMAQNHCGHGSGRGLAVASRDGDAELLAHQLGEQFAARDDGNRQAPRLRDFRIFDLHGGSSTTTLLSRRPRSPLYVPEK